MSYTIPEIRESKSIPNMVAISGIEPEPIANFFSYISPEIRLSQYYFYVLLSNCYHKHTSD